jgi:hypothetical protein
LINMTTTLITWARGHFCIRHSTSYQSKKTTLQAACDDFWFLSDTADEDLSDMATDQHIASGENCPKFQEPVSVSFWRVRANEAISDLRDTIYAGIKRIYLETGARYVTLDFSQKARYAHDDRCALAHQQFWISKTPRHQDPFFAPLENILSLCDQADLILKDSKTHADVKKAFVHVNSARAEVGRLIAPLDDLMSGVRLISEVASRYKDFDYNKKTELMSRESMVSSLKGPSWFNRMEDWRDEAIAATLEASGTRR